MSVSIYDLQRQQRTFTNWHVRGRIRKVDPKGIILPGEFLANGEVIQVSPRYQKGAAHFRVRPERPAAFLAAWCFERKLLPALLTPEECQDEAVLQLLDKLWVRCQSSFALLASPLAASDASVQPGPRTGWSWNLLQVLVEPIESIRTVARGPAYHPATNGFPADNDLAEVARQTIEALRARSQANGHNGHNGLNGHAASSTSPVESAVSDSTPLEEDPDYIAMKAEMERMRQAAEGSTTQPITTTEPTVAQTTTEEEPGEGLPVEETAEALPVEEPPTATEELPRPGTRRHRNRQ